MVGASIFDALGVPFQYCLEFFTNIFKAIGPLNTVGAFGLAVIEFDHPRHRLDARHGVIERGGRDAGR